MGNVASAAWTTGSSASGSDTTVSDSSATVGMEDGASDGLSRLRADVGAAGGLTGRPPFCGLM